MKRKERLNDARLHVKDSRAIGFAAGNVEGHFRECARRINRVVMAHDKKLPGWPRFIWSINQAQMVTAIFLRDALDADALIPPLFSDHAATTVRRGLFEARRFCGRQAPPSGCAATERPRLIMDVVEIQKILPHRFPFLFVDAIVEMERLKSIVGLKNVTLNEAYFQGHFPGAPVMPGVLIIESMAQTGGLLLLQEVPDRENKLLYFAAVDGARFRRPVVPGDQLRVELKVLNWRGDFC